MSAHSPGPWTVAEEWDGEDAAISSAKGYVVGYAWNPNAGRTGPTADARLMASAPELLAMLERVVTAWQPPYEADRDEIRALLKRVRDVP